MVAACRPVSTPSPLLPVRPTGPGVAGRDGVRLGDRGIADGNTFGDDEGEPDSGIARSMMASLVKANGTNSTDTSAPVSAIASATDANTRCFESPNLMLVPTFRG